MLSRKESYGAASMLEILDITSETKMPNFSQTVWVERLSLCAEGPWNSDDTVLELLAHCLLFPASPSLAWRVERGYLRLFCLLALVCWFVYFLLCCCCFVGFFFLLLPFFLLFWFVLVWFCNFGLSGCSWASWRDSKLGWWLPSSQMYWDGLPLLKGRWKCHLIKFVISFQEICIQIYIS